MPVLTHGPLVGAATDTTAAIWLRATEKGEELEPRFFLMIGDNVYVDKHIELRILDETRPPAESLLELYREAYRDSLDYRTFRRALMQTPTYMIFDDHEFWDNWNNSAVHQHDREGFLCEKKPHTVK